VDSVFERIETFRLCPASGALLATGVHVDLYVAAADNASSFSHGEVIDSIVVVVVVVAFIVLVAVVRVPRRAIRVLEGK